MRGVCSQRLSTVIIETDRSLYDKMEKGYAWFEPVALSYFCCLVFFDINLLINKLPVFRYAFHLIFAVLIFEQT